MAGFRGPVNAWLDGIPREHVWVTGRAVPAFGAAGLIGFQLAAVVAVVGAVRIDGALTTAVGLALVGAGSFHGWSRVRRFVLRRDDLVLLEHAWVFVGATAAFLAVTDEAVWAWLDVAAVGLCAFLAVGRIGCLMAGCCHGAPSDLGIVYPSRSHCLSGIRLFPVQLVEAAALAALGAWGLVALGTASAGAIVLALAAAYAMVRLGTEALRADVRPRGFAGTTARVMAAAQLAGAAALDVWRRDGEWGARIIAPAAVLAAVLAAAWGLAHLRGVARPLGATSIAEVRAQVTRPGPTPLDVHDAGNGVTVAVSDDGGRRHVSIAVAGQARGTSARLMTIALGREPDVVTTADVAHAWLDATPATATISTRVTAATSATPAASATTVAHPARDQSYFEPVGR